MITVEDLAPNAGALDPEIEGNLGILAQRLTILEEHYGKPFKINDGFRTWESHVATYRLIAKRKGVPFDESVVPKKSKHLFGQAADIDDDERGTLAKWIQENMDLMERIGFWFEDFRYTRGWVHAQIVPPRSGRRVFIPA